MNAEKFYNNGIGSDIERVHKNITIELMENYAKHYHECKVKNLHLQNVSKCYTEKDMDNAYDKGFNDGSKRDLTGSLIEVL